MACADEVPTGSSHLHFLGALATRTACDDAVSATRVPTSNANRRTHPPTHPAAEQLALRSTFERRVRGRRVPCVAALRRQCEHPPRPPSWRDNLCQERCAADECNTDGQHTAVRPKNTSTSLRPRPRWGRRLAVELKRFLPSSVRTAPPPDKPPHQHRSGKDDRIAQDRALKAPPHLGRVMKGTFWSTSCRGFSGRTAQMQPPPDRHGRQPTVRWSKPPDADQGTPPSPGHPRGSTASACPPRHPPWVRLGGLFSRAPICNEDVGNAGPKSVPFRSSARPARPTLGV